MQHGYIGRVSGHGTHSRLLVLGQATAIDPHNSRISCSITACRPRTFSNICSNISFQKLLAGHVQQALRFLNKDALL